MNKTCKVATLASSLVLVAASGAGLLAQTYLGPTPYLSRADSPFIPALPITFLDDIEDATLDLPGVTANGVVVLPGPITDSVDADDGAIEGSGLAGHTFFNQNGSAGITLTFNPVILGGFPTHVGLVWTDGKGTTSFEAFGASGGSLGVHGPFSIANGTITGETDEDRFFGINNPGGVSAVKISNTQGGIEIDHIQFHAPGFLLTSDQHKLVAGAPLNLTTSGGLPGAANLLAVVGANGAPTFARIGLSTFHPAGLTTLSATVPSGFAGWTIDFLSVGFAAAGPLKLSNIARIRFH